MLLMSKCLGKVHVGEIHLIALEAITKLGLVNLENCPVFCEKFLTNAMGDGWGAEDVAKDVVFRSPLVIVDLM